VSPEDIVDAGTLFRHHAAFVAGFLVRLGAERAELDDIVQEVFMIAHRRGGYRPGPARPTTWLADIALRVLSNRRRSKRRARVHADASVVEAAADPLPSLQRQSEGRESLRRVQAALDRLDEDKRAVFVLFEIEGETCESIAAGLEVPIGTVYSRLHAARAQFTKAHSRLLAREQPTPSVASVGGAR
jgi:RNA polymerase sigma-70 factor (ECF subfamily)